MNNFKSDQNEIMKNRVEVSLHGEKRFAGLASCIVDIEPTNFFTVPVKF